MNCDEELLAMHAGGDLSDAEAAVLEAHVAGCAPCRRLLAEFRELRAGTLALRGEDLPEMWPGVREALAPRRRVPAWVVLPAAAAAAMAALFFIFAEKAVPPPAVPHIAAQSPPAASPGGNPKLRRAVPVRRTAKPLPRREPGEPLIVKLVTDDPDIVIYWQVSETQGDRP